MRSFCAVAEVGSFSAAARRMELSAPMVSRHIGALESHLGIRLFNRTTRHVELSEAGQLYYPRCLAVIEQLDELEADMAGIGRHPTGLLRVSVPMDFGRLFLGQAIRQFLSRAQGIRMDVVFEDRLAHLLQEQVDVAIRIGQPEDSSLVGRTLGQACMGCYASPDYLAQHGGPQHPAELEHHHLLAYSLARTPGSWSFEPRGETVEIAGRWRLSCNNGRALVDAACRGLGIIRVPEFLVGDYLETGGLVEVLRPFRSLPLQITAVYLHREFKPAKVSAWVDFLISYFQRNTDWTPRPI